MNRQPDMRQLLKQAQKMQEQMLTAQEDLAGREFEGTSGGGMVKAVVTGGNEVVSISISPEVIDPDDAEMLEDLVVAAVNGALRQAQQAAGDQMGGLDMGGLGGLLG